MVDLPEAERPVNQRVKPCCLRRVLRSCVVTVDECHVMFLGGGEWGGGALWAMGRRTYVAITVDIMRCLYLNWVGNGVREAFDNDYSLRKR